jgi:hypothetical protein
LRLLCLSGASSGSNLPRTISSIHEVNVSVAQGALGRGILANTDITDQTSIGEGSPEELLGDATGGQISEYQGLMNRISTKRVLRII